MISFLKRTILFGIIALSLSPLSFNINTLDKINFNEPLSFIEIEYSFNQVYAINLNCDTFAGFSTDFGCSVSEGILTVWEWIWFYTTQIGVALVGYVLDIFIFLSIDSQFYRSGLIETGWEILRDFTNIVFIFSFVLMAFKMVLGVGGAKVKQQLVKTVLIALTVNFSLFISFAVIDASNILAHTFYNKIDAKASAQFQKLNDDNAGSTTDPSSLAGFLEDFVGEDTRSVSLAIAGNINPQTIVTGNASKGFFENFIIITAAGLINVLLIIIFIKMISVFLGRTLGLMFSSMLSALAFVSLTIPGMENKSYIGFNKWLQELISTAMMAPVFLFFIYLAVTFIKDKGFLASLAADPSQDLLTRILVVFVPFLVVGGVLMVAKKISSDMVGELGKSAVKGVGMLAGGVIAAPAVVAGGAFAAGGALAAGGGALASGAGAGLSRMGASRVGGALLKGGKKASRVGKHAMSLKADVTKLPGFKTIVGKDNTKMISKVTGRSALGHIKEYKKKNSTKGAFGFEGDNIRKDSENNELKQANGKAKQDRRKAESKFDAELYQKRLEQEQEHEKMKSDTSFTDAQGQKGGIKEAQNQSENEKTNIDELNKTLKEIKENGIDTNYSGSDLDKNNAAQEKQDHIQELETKISVSQDNKQTADTFIQNVAVEYKKKEKEVANVRAKQKEAGDTAEDNSRFKSAARASSDDVANKIINKKAAKGDGLEDAIKKVFKEKNIKLDTDEKK